jgi:hypothetical protein
MYILYLTHDRMVLNTWINENWYDLEFYLATSLMEAMFVREKHFTFPEYITLSNAQLTDIINIIVTM